MSSLDQARETQLRNIEAKTGKTVDELRQIIQQSGLSKHGEIRQMLIDRFGLGYGDANALVHYALATDGQSAAEAAGASVDAVLDEIYSGKKADMRPVHEALVAEITSFGEYETVPKKGYVSLRRKKQFAMLGPGSKSRFELGLNLKGLEPTGRLEALPPGGMCQYRVFLTSIDEIDPEIISWVKLAYDQSG